MLRASVLATVVQVVAAMLAGALNAVAGGGSFLTFPALLFSGVPAVTANATSTVALWPGGAASAWAYRSHLKLPRQTLLAFCAVSLAGGTAGALLLVWTPSRVFVTLVPFLLLLATLAFTFGERLTRTLRAQGEEASQARLLRVGLPLQLLISVYGGYFGGGMGFMLLAAYALLGLTDLHQMNGLKNALAVLLNGAALVTFVLTGTVAWGPALWMAAGAIAGGYGGASLARRVEGKKVRPWVVAVGWGMTAVFFYRTFTAP